MAKSDRLVTLREASLACGLSSRVLHRRIQAGHLRAERDQMGRWLVSVRDAKQQRAHNAGRKPVARMRWLRAINDGLVTRTCRTRWVRSDTGEAASSYIRADILALGYAIERAGGAVDLSWEGCAALVAWQE